MSRLTADDLLDVLGRLARRHLLDEQRPEMVATYHLVLADTKDGVEIDDLVIACPWRNQVEKDTYVASVKKAAEAFDPILAGFVTEAWMVNDPGPLDQIPSQSPKRIEAVIATVTDGRVTKSRTWLMKRSRPGGPLVDLVLRELQDETVEVFNRLFSGLVRPR